jgi:hypothetical protein
MMPLFWKMGTNSLEEAAASFFRTAESLLLSEDGNKSFL